MHLEPDDISISDAGPVVLASKSQLLNRIMAEGIRIDASDIHLSSGLPPYMRLHGRLESSPLLPSVSAEELQGLTETLLHGLGGNLLAERGSVDGAVALGGYRFRFNVYRRGGELAIAFRRLEDRFRTLEELGLPASLYELSKMIDGLIVFAGPTGAGKSTSLATLLDEVNRTRACHMITIEDPIEYVHIPQLALVNQRQIGVDSPSFSDALVAAMRQDPDVILVGEIRDLATIRTAITAAETGHLVFTTVHAGDCVGAVERMISVFPADEQEGVRRQLALVLRAIVAQRLVIADGTHPENKIEAASNEDAGTQTRRLRVVTSEILRVTDAVSNLVASGKASQVYTAMETGTAFGMQTFEQDLARLWVDRRISEATALALSRNPAAVKDRAAVIRRRGPSHGATRRATPGGMPA